MMINKTAKLKHLLLFVFFIFSIHGLYAQKIDSLENVFNTTSSELEKLDATMALCTHYRTTDEKKHLYYIRAGEKIAIKNNKISYVLQLKKEYTYILRNRGEIDSCIIILKEAEKIAEEDGYIPAQLSITAKLAYYYELKGDFTNATDYYFRTLELADSVKVYGAIVASYAGIADLYSEQGQLEKAIEYTNIAFSYCDSVHEGNQDHCRAINNSDLAYYNNLMGQYDTSIVYSKKAITINLKIERHTSLTYNYDEIGISYYKKNEFKMAKKYFHKQLDIGREIGFRNAIIRSLNNLVLINAKEGNTKKAKEYFVELENLMIDYQDIAILKSFLNAKKHYYKAIKNYNKAYLAQEEYYHLTDSLKDNKSLKIIANLETKYATEKYKQKKIIAEADSKISKAEANKSKIISLYAVIFAAILLGLAIYIFSKLKIIRKQKKELNIAYQQLEESKKNELTISNLKALQAQMNPHFIFNALNSVQDLVLLQDIRSSNRYLGKFSDLIRKILLSSKKQFIALEEEIEILSLYLDLEKLRFGDDFNVDFRCDINEVSQDEIMLPAMFIQPYIENAIKHGLFHKKGLKKLKVYFNLKDNYLECIVEDNGVGQKKAEEFKIKRLHLHTGFSTEAINDRIRLLNETLDRKIILKIEDLFDNDTPKGTKITLLFPV